MRRKEIIKGLKNSTRFRVFLDGVGLYMSISDTEKCFATSSHRVATQVALQQLVNDKCNGIGTTVKVYDNKLQSKLIQVQVDLI
jgi:hypothetical protein